jgi:hypothetical protein
MERKMKIILEPELEVQAVSLTASQCRALSRVYRRWSRQLYVKAKMLELHQSPSSRPKGLRWLPQRRQRMN